MRATDQSLPNQIAHCILHHDFQFQIERRNRALLKTMAHLQKARTAQNLTVVAVADRGGVLKAGVSDPGYRAAARYRADQNDDITGLFEPLGGDMRLLVDQPDHPDSRGWIDHASLALII